MFWAYQTQLSRVILKAYDPRIGHHHGFNIHWKFSEMYGSEHCKTGEIMDFISKV